MPPFLWADFPVQYLVPLVFFVIWIINQIFGQEGKAKPPVRREAALPRDRPSRGPTAPPARAGEPMMSWSDRMGGEPARAPAPPPREDFLVIGPERPPKRPANRQGRDKSKQQARPRPAVGAGPGPGESDTRSLLGAKMPGLHQEADLVPERAGPPAMDGLFQSLRDPAKVREAVILNEILQPPVALRRRPGTRSVVQGSRWPETEPSH